MTLSLSTKAVGQFGGAGGFSLSFLTPGSTSDPNAVWYSTHVALNSSLVPIDPATDESVQAITAAIGVDGVSPPALPGGATGVRGWLRAIYATLTGTLNVSGSVSVTDFPAIQPVSATALPLPNGAAQDGTDVTGIAMPAGGAGIRGWLSAAYGKLSAIASSLSNTLSVSGSVSVSNLPATQPISAAALPLPVGAMADATGQSILTALQGQRAESLWTDDTGAYFVRIDKGGSISWADLSGNPLSAPVAGSRPAAGTTVLLSRSSFQATASGTGYSSGDFIDHFVTTDPSSGQVIGNFWVDLNTGAKLASAPVSANIAPVAPLPTGAAKDTSLQAIATVLGGSLAVKPSIGSPAEVSPTLPSAAAIEATNLLATQAAGSRLGLWYFQNQSANTLYVVLDDGSDNNLSYFAVDPGAGANRQGGDIGHYNVGPHTGRLRVFGPAASQFSLRVQ